MAMILEEIARKMCAKGKGILAADESTGTIAKRFKSINVDNTEKNRIAFRQTLFNSDGMKNYIGGVILFDETIKQKTSIGPTVPELIVNHGAVPGIKVDKGAKPLAGSLEETVTEGLDGLRERLAEYYKLGNVINEDPIKIFNNHGFKKYRDKWLSNDYKSLDHCKDCKVYLSRFNKTYIS